jgi:long-chain acyl-CoA synthetase
MSGPLTNVLKWWHHGDMPSVPIKPIPESAADNRPWRATLQSAGIPLDLVYPSTCLGRLLDQSADRFGDAIAMVYNKKTWTYRQLQADSNRIAGGLSHLGVRRRDRVLLVLPNCPEFVSTFFAIQKLGAVAVNVGPLMGADDLEKAIDITTPRVAVGLDLRAPTLARASRKAPNVEHWVWSSLESYQTALDRLGYRMKRWYGGNGFAKLAHHHLLQDLMNEAPSRPPSISPDQNDVAVLQATGGTTGGLKLAQLSHRNLLCNALQVSACMDSRPGQDRILALLPMFHVYGLTTCLISGIFSAAQMILLTRFDAAKALETIREYSPTIFPLVPAVADALCDRLEEEHDESRPLKSVRLCLSGAAPLTARTAERFNRLSGTQIHEGYGLTEAAPVTHSNFAGHSKLGTIGVPIPGTLARVDAKPGEAGELLISGPQVMLGYFGDPEQNRDVLTADADGRIWLHTGDIATMDADGFFQIVDRKKDMIIRSGMKVYPSKVERVLLDHQAVKEVAVYGRPDPVHTEEVVAAIVLKESHPNPHALIEELRALCRQRLAPYEVPQAIEFLEVIPRSPLGKILKNRLRELAVQAKHLEVV